VPITAIQTGLALTPAIVGILLASLAAERMASRRSQRTLVRAGFVTNAVGMSILVIFGRAASSWSLAVGLLREPLDGQDRQHSSEYAARRQPAANMGP
jgi:predicted benzoate:H+ symporter BenE